MTPATGHLSPQQRLARSRHAIAAHLSRGDATPPAGAAEAALGEPVPEDVRGERASRAGWMLLRHAAHAWWRHHPGRAVVRMARPALEGYARDKPLQLMAIATGAGAAAVVLRPWRLMTLTGLLAVAFRSSELSRLVLPLLSSGHHPSPSTRKPHEKHIPGTAGA